MKRLKQLEDENVRLKKGATPQLLDSFSSCLSYILHLLIGFDGVEAAETRTAKASVATPDADSAGRRGKRDMEGPHHKIARAKASNADPAFVLTACNGTP